MWSISSPTKLTFDKNFNRRGGEYRATNFPPNSHIEGQRTEEKSFDELKQEHIKVGDGWALSNP